MLQITSRFSSKLIKKGDIFTIYIDIINGHEKTIKIKAVTISRPMGFIPLTYEHQERKQTPFLDKIFKRGERYRKNVSQITLRGWDYGALASSFAVTESPVEYEKTNEKIRGASLIRELNESIEAQSTYSEIFYFKAGWSGGLRPRPDTYTIYCDVTYELDTKIYHHQLSIDISIFPSFGSMLAGTLIGGVLGTFLKEILSKENIMKDILANGLPATVGPVIPILFSNLIIGFIVLVLLMRKQDVQPFVTIEDFWGGILVVFITSYTSSQILDQLSKIQIISTPGQ